MLLVSLCLSNNINPVGKSPLQSHELQSSLLPTASEVLACMAAVAMALNMQQESGANHLRNINTCTLRAGYRDTEWNYKVTHTEMCIRRAAAYTN